MPNLFVLSGPSGAGKGTLLEELKNLGRLPCLKSTVSCTTRKPRAGEMDGRHYYFVSKEEFTEDINKGNFLEWALVHGNYYGTLKNEVSLIKEKNCDALLEIDVQGALQVKKLFSDAVMIFVTAPSIEELIARLKIRGSETEEDRKIRIENAKKELCMADNFDFKIINNNLNEAVEELVSIIENKRSGLS